jgi:polysaccharide export outer membrane protein
MNILRGIFVLALFLPTLATSLAQQPTGKPVLSAQPSPAPEPAPPPPPAGTPMISASYVIGAQDSIQITVWKEPQLSGTFPVRPDGMISLPLVGDILAAGFTPTQLSADITTKLKQFLTDPVVDVAVMAVNSKVVFFVGEVGRVGPLALTPGMTILQAIASAGGLTAYANKKKIYVLRGEQGKQTKIPFDYNKALKKDDMQGVSLVPGDTIVVP